jgi:hypothetical protein
MAVFTNAGLTLLATALQANDVQTAVTYVSVGLGAGTLSSGLTNGSPYTSLPLQIALAVNISNGQSLTLVNSGGNTQVITASGVGNVIGATSITVTSFNANATYAIGSGVVNTPAASDLALQNEAVRLSASTGSAGSNPGESLNAGYFDPSSTSTGIYLEVGYWGGSSATSTLGTGTLMARDVQYWNHTVNSDSASYQLDTTL